MGNIDEPTTSGQRSVVAPRKHGRRYDVFLSYSHAADAHLAPGLQSGLQGLARPWWRPRALRVFRDKTGLSATPSLWTAIVAAMDASAWFVLLASKHAAQSPWVNEEVAHWLSTRGPDRILIVHTDGELRWDRAQGDFDRSATTALPPAVFGAFRSEPLHVDMRWARTETDASPRNARFLDQVAELAATVHGVSKDDLVGEDALRQRQTRRVVRSAVTLLLALATTASALAIVANQQRRTADRARLASKENETKARAAATQAKKSEAAARSAQIDAERRRKEAETERAAAEKARHAALDAEAKAQTANSKLQQVNGDLETAKRDLEDTNAELEKRRNELAAANELLEKSNRELTAANEEVRKERDTVVAQEREARSRQLALASGKELDAHRPDTAGLLAAEAAVANPNTLTRKALFDVAVQLSKGVVSIRQYPTGYRPSLDRSAVSPDGRWLAVGDSPVDVFDLHDLTRAPKRLACFAREVDVMAFGTGPYLMTLSLDRDFRVWDVRTGTEVSELTVEDDPGCKAPASNTGGTGTACAPLVISGRRAAASPDGSVFVLDRGDGRVRFVDATSGRLLADRRGTFGIDIDRQFSPDGSVALGFDGTTPVVWDLRHGAVPIELRDTDGPLRLPSYSHDGRRLLAINASGRIVEVALDTLPAVRVIANAEQRVTGLAMNADGTVAVAATDSGSLTTFDLRTGTTAHWQVDPGNASRTRLSATGRTIVVMGGNGTTCEPGVTARFVSAANGVVRGSIVAVNPLVDGLDRIAYVPSEYTLADEKFPTGVGSAGESIVRTEFRVSSDDALTIGAGVGKTDGTRVVVVRELKSTTSWQLSGFGRQLRLASIDDGSVVGFDDQYVVVWDPHVAGPGTRLAPASVRVELSDDLRTMAVPGSGRTIEVRVARGARRVSFTDPVSRSVPFGDTGVVTDFDLSPDGSLLYANFSPSVGRDHTVVVRTADGRRILDEATSCGFYSCPVRFGNGGSLFVVLDGRSRWFDAAGAPLTLTPGTMVAHTAPTVARVDGTNTLVIGTITQPEQRRVALTPALDAGTNRVAAIADNGSVAAIEHIGSDGRSETQFRSTTTGAVLSALPSTNGGELSADGSLQLSSAVRDVATGEVLAELGPIRTDVRPPAPVPTSVGGGLLYGSAVFTLDVPTMVASVCAAIGRNLTVEERRQFAAPAGVTKVCPV